jgi:hypothetical protein
VPLESSSTFPEHQKSVVPDKSGDRTMSAESVTTSTTALPAREAESSAEIFPADSVFAGRRKKKVLMSEVVEFKTSKLRRRKPQIVCDDAFLAVIDDE